MYWLSKTREVLGAYTCDFVCATSLFVCATSPYIVQSKRTPLTWAIKHSDVELISVLIAAGADPTLPDEVDV